MSLLRHTASVAGAGALVLALGVPVASAGDLPLTQDQMLQASIRLADVPASFSDDPTRSPSYSGPRDTEPFEMCVDKDGHKVFGPRPVQRANVSIGLSQTGSGSDITAARAVSTDIYGYQSTTRAAKAWKAVSEARARCERQVNKPMDFNGVSIDIEVVQTLVTSRAYRGMPGFTLEQDVSTDVSGGAEKQELAIFVDGYTSYRRVGTTIVRAQFANYDQESLQSVTLTPAWRKFTRQAARIVADRIWDRRGQ